LNAPTECPNLEQKDCDEEIEENEENHDEREQEQNITELQQGTLDEKEQVEESFKDEL